MEGQLYGRPDRDPAPSPASSVAKSGGVDAGDKLGGPKDAYPVNATDDPSVTTVGHLYDVIVVACSCMCRGMHFSMTPKSFACCTLRCAQTQIIHSCTRSHTGGQPAIHICQLTVLLVLCFRTPQENASPSGGKPMPQQEDAGPKAAGQGRLATTKDDYGGPDSAGEQPQQGRSG